MPRSTHREPCKSTYFHQSQPWCCREKLIFCLANRGRTAEYHCMVPAKTAAGSSRLPDGYLALPVHRVDESPLRLCVVVRQTPDPGAGQFVILRELHDARVYAGCVTDAGGRLREWVELWVQNV